MARRSTQRSGSTSILEDDAPLDLSDSTPEPPPYVPPPVIPPEPAPVAEDFSAMVTVCHSASYSLLDQRDGQWKLLRFGDGEVLRSFQSKDEGIEFVRKAKIENCRCLSLTTPDNPLGIIL